jgi:hypothetical protein
MADDIDSLVKGASLTSPASVKDATGTSPILSATGKVNDPLNHTPSSPAMVYLNLLILEASLRAQYLELRARKRHHTFFLGLLMIWVVFFGYKLYFAPREDGRGVGGSIYWAVEGAQRVCFMGGIVTGILIWATGFWERGIRWPRRWFSTSNRGLRSFNCKLVIIRRPWWAEGLSTIGFFLTYGLFSQTSSSSYRHVDPSLLREVEKELQLSGDNHPTLILPSEDEERGGHEEDLAPGGDYVKLLLLAKPFSATFRENWELYRTEYWERENERRALLRQKVKEQDHRLAKQHYGWLWWLPWAQVLSRRKETGKVPAAARPVITHDKVRKRRSSSVRRGSVSSSRSQTPTLDLEDEKMTMTRKASTASNAAGDKQRRKKPPVTTRNRRSGTDSRSVTPEIPSPLIRESSVGGDESGPGETGRVLRNSKTKSAAVRERQK